jgi:hypothetical protein
VRLKTKSVRTAEKNTLNGGLAKNRFDWRRKQLFSLALTLFLNFLSFHLLDKVNQANCIIENTPNFTINEEIEHDIGSRNHLHR